MSRTKQQLIEKIIELLLREFEPHSVSARDREFLEMATVEYLENKLKELQAEAVANLRKQHADNIEEIEERVAKVQAEREASRILFQLQRQEQTAPQRRAEAARQLAHDQVTFAEAARKFGIGSNQANLNLIRQTVGPNFSLHQIQQALDSGAIQLSAATQAEQDQWEQEARDREVQRTQEELAEAVRQYDRGNPVPLRAIRDRERVQAASQPDERFQREQQAQKPLGFPDLPSHFKGQALDRAFLINAPKETLRFLIAKYGTANINARIAGREN